MIPCLPQKDWLPGVRKARLTADRFIYQYDRDYHDLPFPLEWPLLGLFPPRYYARLAALTLAVDANQWASDALTWLNSGRVLDDFVAWMRKPERLELEYTYGEREPPPRFSAGARTPESLRTYDRLLPLLPKPAAAALWCEPEFFAWQRVAGAYPIALRSTDSGEAWAPALTSAIDRALAPTSDCTEAARKEQRLFIVEYPLAKGLPAGFGDGWRRYLPEVSGYFVRPPRQPRIQPVAIRCGDDGVFTPRDGAVWDAARAVLQAVESTVHGVAEHGVACHIVLTLIALATYRCLGHNHPLRVLLTPHFEFTIPVTLVTKSFFSPGGRTINLQSVSLQGCIELARRRWGQFDWTRDTVPGSIQTRGLLAPEILPEYPFRDDVLLLEQVIRSWVLAYVGLYYDDDEPLDQDHELQNWLRELSAAHCAGIAGIPKIEKVDDLVRLVTQIIHRATAYHAAINDPVYDAMGYVPNMPGACYDAPPLASASAAPDPLTLLPPRDKAQAQIADVYVVSNTKLNRLGHYPACTFVDPRVWPLQRAFLDALGEAERTIEERNRTRFLPYRVLLPSRLTASINV
ncbi:MAG TPA: lipoxygenase family protein [Polyangiaceae bacterium]|nr:lipoxygenase family protein [Polyangiaceae bacterium]